MHISNEDNDYHWVDITYPVKLITIGLLCIFMLSHYMNDKLQVYRSDTEEIAVSAMIFAQ